MDQRGDRRRAFHRVRQPGMQTKLRRLPARPHEQKQTNAGNRFGRREGHPQEGEDFAIGFRRHDSRNCCEDIIESQRTRQDEDAENPECKAKVTDPVHDEGLDCRGIRARLLIPEADQQIGRETDPFPAEEHLNQVVGGYQHQHHEGEQAEIRLEPRNTGIVMHIAGGIDMHQRGNRGHNDQHHSRQRVDPDRPIEHEIVDRDPPHKLDGVPFHGLTAVEDTADVEEGDPGQDRSDHQQSGCYDLREEVALMAADGTTTKSADQRANERQEYD